MLYKTPKTTIHRYLVMCKTTIHRYLVMCKTTIHRYLVMCKTTILTKQLEIRAEFQHVDITLPAERPGYQRELLENYLTKAGQRYEQNSEYVVSSKLVVFSIVIWIDVTNIRVVATTPEKTHNQKFLNFETILNRFLVQFYPGSKKKLPPLYINQLKCGIRPPPPRPDAFWGTTL